MRRTTHYQRKWRSIYRVCHENRRLILYGSLWAVGLVVGLLIRSELVSSLKPIASIASVEISFSAGIANVLSSCFSTLCLLMVLFLSGLSACGAPITAFVPLFYGLGLGLSQAYWGSQGQSGLLISALWVWPHSVIETIALLMGCCEALRLSLRIAAQLVPGGTIGSLWRDFKLYLLRFLLFLLIALSAGVVDVLLRMFIPL